MMYQIFQIFCFVLGTILGLSFLILAIHTFIIEPIRQKNREKTIHLEDYNENLWKYLIPEEKCIGFCLSEYNEKACADCPAKEDCLRLFGKDTIKGTYTSRSTLNVSNIKEVIKMTPGFRRLLAFLVIIAALCAAYFLTGCATNTNRLRHTQETEVMDILETEYMAKYKAADFDTQIQWRYQVDPQLKKARFALFSWDVAMAVNEDGIALEKERSFYIVKKKFTCFFSEKN